MFEIEYSRQAQKFLKRLNRKLLLRILNRLEHLKVNPIPSDAKFIRREKNDKTREAGKLS